ncbi:MAG: twin-arginine translocase TatA/TatE family subunit [Armatimonadetes bacterium]|nr:twin-arginine translocase TatA/TatE family subunit [Armatimonadota bacterium]NIM24441.1 twin-arginine translocase TatA/TatE family subunit [Armatimonadota bacterium]NIM68312.1 twin-arginine translocase TatA/TatE family subunit [Armatimonadota bacterium]NIM76716.1 twin-arginine translocase TatA/TatE family subunit [Armatimonadota bacterium]NIN06515.1 twin-arginine translocase TatA/TatE family subunit [Armatimonadota bacterium]
MFLSTLGPGEIALIVVVALLLFGARRLPELGKAVGQGIRELRKSISGLGEEVSPGDEDKDSSSTK